VIEGFEEYQNIKLRGMESLWEFSLKKPELFAGVWTWSRGGGWGGPYITNEFWCHLNGWVVSHWAQDPTKSEEELFATYCRDELKLGEEDARRFRRLCLLSAEAVVRGRNSTHGDMNPWWTRDMGIGWPGLGKAEEAKARILAEKDEAVAKWKTIVDLAEPITWADDKTRNHAVGSSLYGLRLYEIYRSLVFLASAEKRNDDAAIKKWIAVYDEAWAVYRELPQKFPSIGSLYSQDYDRHIRDNAHRRVETLRKR